MVIKINFTKIIKSGKNISNTHKQKQISGIFKELLSEAQATQQKMSRRSKAFHRKRNNDGMPGWLS